MKREIKFRAWDEKLKMMTTPFIDFLFFEESETFKGGQLLHQNFEDDDFIPTEIMQFTGLKDKNGKEIYESDIVRTDARQGNMKVIYFDAYASFMLEIDGLLYPLNEGADIEVIGNIYINPELLNQ